ncbi:MAG: pilin [Candidatus Paceibacterota bacterium]|jgi:hypothetical protein
MNKKSLKSVYKFISIFSFIALIPIISFAAASTCDSLTGIGKLICQMKEILNSIIPVLVSLGVVYFVWGVVQYVIADGEEAKKTGKDRMIYGLIGFAVIVGLWGLVNIIVNTFGLSGVTAPSLAPLTGASSTCTMGTNFQGVLSYVTCIINNSIIPLIFALATVMFVWGAVNFFIINADEEAKRAQGKQFMVWGIIALAVMLSVWGLVGILTSTFGINGNILPQVRPPGSSSSTDGGGNTGDGFVGPCPSGTHNDGTACVPDSTSGGGSFTCSDGTVVMNQFLCPIGGGPTLCPDGKTYVSNPLMCPSGGSGGPSSCPSGTQYNFNTQTCVSSGPCPNPMFIRRADGTCPG